MQADMNVDTVPVQTTPRQQRRQLTWQLKDAQDKVHKSLETLTSVLSKRTDAKKEDDECDLYGKLLVQKLRKFSNYERHVLMHKIDGLLLQTPPSHTRLLPYDASYSSSSTHSSPSPLHVDMPTSPLSAAPISTGLQRQSVQEVFSDTLSYSRTHNVDIHHDSARIRSTAMTDAGVSYYD